MAYRRIKRVLDVVGAASALAVLLVPIAVVAVLIRRRMGSPVLYRAVRAGLHGRSFVLLKFRTMANTVDAAGNLLPDKERITPLGRLLRKTSVDELPQLLNVLRGDMSLVGPRPLRADYLPRYNSEQARRHHVMPGITGLAQISGRNALTWEQRFALDVYYVDHLSLRLDLQILARTAVKVLTAGDVAPDGDLDLPMFTGTPAS